MLNPVISVIIPTFNEESNISKCLNSIRKQNFPQKKIEIIVVDNYSTDKTLSIARKYKVKILLNKIKHAEVSKMIGFEKAKGNYVFYLDADIRLRGENWINLMIKPLEENKNIVGSFTRYYSDSKSSIIERYLNLDPLQRDGIYQFFSPSISSLVVKKLKNYQICVYSKNKIPPAGLCVYKRKRILPLIRKYRMFLELDFLVLFTKNNLNMFAYVPKAGLYHTHVKNFANLLLKRKYNLEKVYLGRKERLYKWFDVKTFLGLFKILLWVIYANLFFPSLVSGLIKSVRYKDLSGLLEPFVNLILTDWIVLLFVKNLFISKTVSYEKI